MSNLDFVSGNSNGLEVYVSTDGSQTGMSVRGLSRACGVHQKTIQELLKTIATGKTTIESLQHLENRVFVVTGKAEDNAKIVSSEACACVIAYFAHDSQKINDPAIARKSLTCFAMKGIDAWIKELANFDENTKLDLIIEQLKCLGEIKQEIQDLKSIQAKFNKQKTFTSVQFVGLHDMLKDIEEADEEKLALLPSEEEGLTLSEWLLKYHALTLEHGAITKFGRLVAETYKSCARKEPPKVNRKNKKSGKWTNGVRLYHTSEYPLLQMAFEQFISK